MEKEIEIVLDNLKKEILKMPNLKTGIDETIDEFYEELLEANKIISRRENLILEILEKLVISNVPDSGIRDRLDKLSDLLRNPGKEYVLKTAEDFLAKM